jgi:hypothetical protein
MLFKFTVKNYLSFEEETTLNFIPVNRRTHKDHFIQSKVLKNLYALPIAVLYGANASGKSNFIKAVDCARNLIIKGRTDESVIPFKLNPEWVNKPSLFEFVFEFNSIIYKYGFLITKSKVEKEYLTKKEYRKTEHSIFTRITNENNEVKITLGEKLAKGKVEDIIFQAIEKMTGTEYFYLNKAYENNVSIVKPVIEWFTHKLNVIFPGSKYPLLVRTYLEEHFKKELIEFLRKTDTDSGINDIVIREEDIKWDEIDDITKNIIEGQKEWPIPIFPTKDMSKMILKYKNKLIALELKTKHKNKNNQNIEFSINEESDGTIRMMDLFPALNYIKTSDSIYFIDELDRSLHPNLYRFFIKSLLENIGTNQNSRGQLIFTTHQTNLLDTELLRNDEIWFLEKQPTGNSELFSLAEFKVRSDLKIDKGYLQGRFGAVPIIKR